MLEYFMFASCGVLLEHPQKAPQTAEGRQIGPCVQKR